MATAPLLRARRDHVAFALLALLLRGENRLDARRSR
jgi:hypothetical protein